MELDSRLARPVSIAATFGLAVREEVHCSACGKTTQQCSYMQYFYNTQARAGGWGRWMRPGRHRSAEAGLQAACMPWSVRW